MQMFPEKEIVELWLNSKGYLVESGINAGKNKLIDMLALKVQAGRLKEVIHVEISASVSGSSEDISEKFNNSLVRRAILKRVSGTKDYKRWLITSSPSEKSIKGVDVIDFGKVLSDVISGLDKQNYKNPVIRSLQLLKYLLLANPAYLIHTLEALRAGKAISSAGIERILEGMLGFPAAKRVLSREKNLPLLSKALKGSVILKPKALAELISEQLSRRSFNQFLKELFEHDKAKHFTMKSSAKQRLLPVFIE